MIKNKLKLNFNNFIKMTSILYCNICYKTYSSKYSLNLHLTSKKHKKNMEKKEIISILPKDLQNIIIDFKEDMEKYDKELKKWIKDNDNYDIYNYFSEEGYNIDYLELWDNDKNYMKTIFNIFKKNNWCPFEIENKVILKGNYCFEDSCSVFGNYRHHIFLKEDVRIIDLKCIVDDLVEMKQNIDPDHHFYEGYNITEEIINHKNLGYIKIIIRFGS